ncbi:MAG: prolipoprotein diacylglyceryl transferase [Alphaproteobacteria bacterium]|jgi:phosphatidylglycerol:prolipoprotein diacylglycerol transferase|nr:prolipoprotein diacylglyceryl transferase [Alphaproteobacteria bacterium]
MDSLTFPIIDPVAIEIGPIVIRWYALAYIAGLLLGWRCCVMLTRRAPVFMTSEKLDDLLLYATLGVILGGRLGYVLFYKPAFYAANPLEILMVWHGGMSFHGGFLGVVIAAFIFARRQNIPALLLADLLAVAAPVGLFFGRIANFINGELFGRPSDVSWAMVFPHGGPLPRHPSQLYEAGLEGLLLFVIMAAAALATRARFRPGLLLGMFLIGYGAARSFVELFREPDAHLGFILGPITMGQILSMPMILAGLVALVLALRRPAIKDA